MEGELNHAGAMRRFGACLIDALGLLLPILLILYFGFLVGVLSENAAFLYPPVWFIVYTVYVIGFWSRKGQTPGKSLLKVKIVRTDKKPINLSISILRYSALVGPYIIILIGGPFFIIPMIQSVLGKLAIGVALFLLPPLFYILMISISRTKQGPHDRIAHTFVIKTK
jgi:uncharacterized RDD family membrane protein YckC